MKLEMSGSDKLPTTWFELAVYALLHPAAAFILGAVAFAAATACQMGYTIRPHVMEGTAQAAVVGKP